MGRLGVILVIVFCFGVAGVVYNFGIVERTEAQRNAVTVEGTVQSTAVETSQSDSGASYIPVVTYRYEYDGETYTNDQRKLFGGGKASPGGAEEVLEDYAAGDTVTVYVDPDDPSNSFLEKSSPKLTYYGIIAALVGMGLFAVLGLVLDLIGSDYVDMK